MATRNDTSGSDHTLALSTDLNKNNYNEDDDFKFHPDDNPYSWDDSDNASTFNYPDQQPNPPPIQCNQNKPECWTCTNCNTTNNVQECRRKYNSKCCKCQQSYFISIQTDTFSSNEYYLPPNPSFSTTRVPTNSKTATTTISKPRNVGITTYHRELLRKFIPFDISIPSAVKEIILAYFVEPEAVQGQIDKDGYYELVGNAQISHKQVKHWKFIILLDTKEYVNINCIEFGVIREPDRVEVDHKYEYYTLNMNQVKEYKTLKHGYTIYVRLDLELNELSFCINNTFYDYNRDGYGPKLHFSGIYRFYASIKQEGVHLESSI